MRSTGFWAALRATLSGFWFCRVSMLSVLTGWLLFFAAPQAQAVFFDLHTWHVGLWHWAAFYGAVFLFWMLPTQLSTRVMLHAGEGRMPEGNTTWYAILMVHLPWLLALACLVGVAAGQFWAFDHLPDEKERLGRPLENVAFAQLGALLQTTLALIALWLLAWIVLPPIISRLIIKSGLLDVWLFRMIAIAMFGSRATTRTYAAKDSLPVPGGPWSLSPQQLQTAWAAIALFVIWVASLLLIFYSPLDINPALSRAPMIPILVGAWIPALTLIVYGAHRFRLPLLAAFVLLMTFLANMTPGLHDMRVLKQDSQTTALEARQPTLEEALKWWRKANGCGTELRTPCSVRPIIVAAEGGASRAAFFTASILAQLDDLSDPASPGTMPGFSRQLFAISTVSGSSLGAAVYAALREDARGAAWQRPRPELPSNALWFKSGKAFGLGDIKPEPLPATSTRKDIVQQILAGDFLTPAVAAFGLDIWAPLHAKFYNSGDRTYFLERAWENRFNDPSGRTRGSKSTFERGLSSLAPDENTWRPLLILNGTSVTTGRRVITSTLYPLIRSPDDAEDLPDDQRTVELVFRNSYDTYDLMCVSNALATGVPCTCIRPGKKDELQPLRIKGCDVRLSTAVSNSARFPFISSHGDIKAVDGKPVDRIVDGGYFDNSGIVSAMELHVQITRLDDDLKPFVLFLTNDPGFNPQACLQAGDPTQPIDELDVLRRPAVPPSEPIDSELFSIVRYPIETLISARVTRSEQTMAQSVLLNRYQNVKAGFIRAPKAFARLREGRQAYITFDVISVGARCNKAKKQVRPIPLNWWLAMPTQAYLDDEICAPHNRGSIAGVLTQLGEQPGPDDYGRHLDRSDQEKRRVNEYCDSRGTSPTSGKQTR